jgi:Skp family chaperone for outer membrane proteins
MTATALDTADAWAQASATDSGHRIAVIDIAYIYKNAPSIQAQIGKIEADLKNYDRELKQKREALQQAAAELTTLKVGTADYAKQEEAVARMDSKLRLEMVRVRKELANAEAKIYFDNYQRISKSVKLIAVHNGIHLVLRYTGEDMNLENDKSVARGLMKNIVYHEETLDLTEIVMQHLEKPGKAEPVSTASRKASTAKR